jgi:hypothetical protein
VTPPFPSPSLFCRFLLTNVTMSGRSAIFSLGEREPPMSTHFVCIIDRHFTSFRFLVRGVNPSSTPLCRLQSIAHYTLLRKVCALRGHSVGRAFPHWLSPPPPRAVQTLWNNTMSVGADFLPRQSKQSMVAMPLFCKQKSKPLTACF